MKLDASLLERIYDGAQLIVRQRQQSQSIKKQYHRWLEQQHKSVFETPRIDDWQSWINRCWKAHLRTNKDSRIVLNHLQQRLLWEQVIADSSKPGTANQLWNRAASVNTAISAFSLIKDYRLELNRNTYLTEDNRVFMRWYKRYEDQLSFKNWLDPKQLSDMMMAQSFKPVFNQPCLILLDETTPLQQRWLDYLQGVSNNIEKVEYKQTQMNRQLPLHEYSDLDQELYAALNWTMDLFEKDPQSRVVLVVSQLEQAQYRLQSWLNAVFRDRQKALEYTLSTQANLSSSPLIKSALTSLDLLAYDIDYEVFSNFLRNPYLQNSSTDQQANALVDSQLRKQSHQKTTLAKLLYQLERIDIQSASRLILIERLKKIQTFTLKQPSYNSAAKWCEVFSSVLQLLNWPNADKLNQLEVHDLQGWDQLLADLCAATLVKQRLSLTQALALVRAQIASKLRKNKARLHIVDLNQAAAISASHVWVMGLSDSVLPERTQLNPLIVYSLQCEKRLPRSSASLCTQEALQVLANLIETNDQCVLSFHVSEQETQLLPSALLTSNPRIVHADKLRYLFADEKIVLDSYEDDFGVPITDKKIHGGTYLIKDQAICPFQAYAKYRLQADPFEYQEQGVDAKEKGSLIHLVLQKIWQQLIDQKKLLSISDDALKILIKKAVAKQLACVDKVKQPFIAIEQQRLEKVIEVWLSIEKQRPAFKVLEQESQATFSIEGLELKIKPDRIDQLEGGERLILDYKTGSSAKSKNWLGKRLYDPQLPIYQLALNDTVSAISFALIHDNKFDGVSESATQITGIKQVGLSKQGAIKDHIDWPQLEQNWRNGVAQLVSEYKHGYARVDPRDASNGDCKYCRRASLCRIDQHNKNAENE